jgi:hypothetical protein
LRRYSLGDKHKFERFLPARQPSMATVYGPVMYPPAPVLGFKEEVTSKGMGANLVRWCRLKPVFASTESDVLRLGSITQCPCVILCNLTTCYSIESAWFQRLKAKFDESL